MFKKILIVLALLVAILVLIGGYYGFVPGVSALFGSNKARDLGVAASPEALASFTQKTGLTISDSVEATQSIAFAGTKAINTSFTAEEITSFAQSAGWKDFPLDSFQTRYNDDGSIDISGILVPARIEAYMRAHGFDPSPAKPYLEKIAALGINPPVHAVFESSITNDQLTITPKSFELGRYSFSPKDLADNQPLIENTAETLLDAIPGLGIKSLDTQGGKLTVRGTIPASITYASTN